MTKSLILISILSLTLASSSLSNIATNTLTPDQGICVHSGNGNFGYSVSGAGDINGDGVDDIIIGGYSTNGGAGAAYVVYGSKSALADIDLSITTSLTALNKGFKIKGVAGNYIGQSVSYAGDLDADGIDDIIVGPYGYSSSSGPGPSYYGAYVIYGARSGLADIDLAASPSLSALNKGFRIQGVLTSIFVRSVSTAGDLNNDGINDIIVGCSEAYSMAGAAYVIYGSKTRLPDIDLTVGSAFSATKLGFEIKGSAGSHLGQSVSAAGDVNNDRLDDIIIGANAAYGGAGAVYVIFGTRSGLSNIDLTVTPDLSINDVGFEVKGPTVNHGIGLSVSTAGDMNGDGIDDVVIGTKLSSGSAFVVFGSGGRSSNIALAPSSLSNSGQGFEMVGRTGEFLGWSVACAGDTNGDGLSDIVVGSHMAYSGAGAALVVYGSRSGLVDINLNSDQSLSSNGRGFELKGGPSYQFGRSVRNAGDFNGDGAPDIIVGSEGAYSNMGGAYVVFGIFPSLELMKTVTAVVNTGATTIALAGTILNVINFSNPAAIILTSLSEGLLFFQYLSIDYPPRLKYFIDNSESGDTIFSNLLSPPDVIVRQFSIHTLPGKFNNSGFYSSFIVNFWSSIITLLSLTIVTIVISVIGKFCLPAKDSTKNIPDWIFNKIKQVVKWNLMLSTFAGCFGDISLFTAFEIGTCEFGSFVEWLSFFICLLANIAVFFVQIKILIIVLTLQEVKATTGQNKSPKILHTAQEQYKGYEIIFDTFKDNSFAHQNFFFFYNVKLYAFSAILSYWPNTPVLQTILNTMMGFITLTYLLILRPVEGWVDLIQYVFAELIYEIIHVCTLCLAITELLNINFFDGRILMGDIIIGCNSVFMMVAPVFLAIQTLNIIKDLYRFIQNHYFKKKKNLQVKGSARFRNEQTIFRKTDLSLEKEKLSENLDKSSQHLNNSQSFGIDLEPAEQDASKVFPKRNNYRPNEFTNYAGTTKQMVSLVYNSTEKASNNQNNQIEQQP